MDDKQYFTPERTPQASSSKAKSAQVKVDIKGQVVTSATDWHGNPPPPTTVDVSFILDTLSFGSETSQPVTDPAQPSAPCLGEFTITGLATSDMTLQTDQGLLWSAGALSSDFSGQNISGACPGGFSAVLRFDAGNKSFSWSLDASPGISIAALTGSPYPLAELMLGFMSFAGDARITGDWGTLVIATSNNVTMTAVQAQPNPPGNLQAN